MKHNTETLAIHAGREDLRELGVHALPLDFSTTYPFRDLDAATAHLDTFVQGNEIPEDPIYARLFNPTVARFETALAALEETEAAVAFGSGMAALTACLLAARADGSHLVAVRPMYGTTDHVLTSGVLGMDVTWAEPDGIRDAITEETALVIIETPANPTLHLLDIADVVRQAGSVPVLVDSTFATPILQKPALHGATMVLHSATKFIGGHGDVIAGVVATTEAWAKRIRQIRILTGGLLHPMGAYLLHRGLATLPIRVEKAQSNAATLVERLAAHPAVNAVYYPGLQTHDAELLARQMYGAGSIFSFDVGSHEAAARVLRKVKLMTPAVSLGSVDTLIQHPAGLTHRVLSDEARAHGGISEGLLRVSTGIEHADDLWADLQQALAE